MTKEDRVSSEGKSFAEYIVHHARKGSGGRDNTELEELYSEPNTVNVIKPSTLRWTGMLCEWIKKNYLKTYCGKALEVNEDVADRNQDGLTG
jgi:hypothetical protein